MTATTAAPSTASEPAAGPSGGPTWSVRGRHLPALDGLRAVAVLAVVVYHLGYGWARGGYLGVDLFFVLSGFLITSLLLEERAATGTIALGAFWGRRARRLLPALFVMVTAVMAFLVIDGRYGNSAFIASFDLSSLRPQALATLFYFANWQLIATQHSYFAQFTSPSPFQHAWSLAIEEQFYLVWPLLTVGLLARGLERSRRLGASVTAAVAVASAVLMAVLFMPGTDPSHLYYRTDTRIQDLAVGAVLAWVTARRGPVRGRAGSLLGLGALVSMAALLVLMGTAGTPGGVPSSFMFRGGFLGASILCAVVIADVRREGSVLRRVLACRPLVAVGLVSYGVYLWHWPVIVLFSPQSAGMSGAPLLALRLGLIAVLVLASYFVVELPVRRGWLPTWAKVSVYPTGVAVAVAAVWLGTTPSFVLKSYVRASLERYAPATPPTGSGGVVGRPIVLGRTVSRTHPLRVVLFGDSMLEVASPGVIAALEATGEVEVWPGPLGRSATFPGWGTSTDPGWRGYVAHDVRASHAEIVVMTTGWDGPAAEHPAAYERTLRAFVSVARHAGARGVLFLQYPATRPLLDTQAASQATNRANAAWNRAVAAMPAQLPGSVMYFPVAPSVELDGAFSPWLPPPRDPTAPMATWDRVRRVDGVHLCAPGIELYAAAIAADTASAFHLDPPAQGWWVDGWQRKPIVAAGVEFCPADHPG